MDPLALIPQKEVYIPLLCLIKKKAELILFIKLVRKTTSLQVVAIRTNLLVFDILFDNFKRCSATGGDKIAGRP